MRECRNCTVSLQVLKLMSGVWASCCMHYCVAICHLMMIILTVCIGKSWWVLFHLADCKFLVYVLFLGLEILASLLAVLTTVLYGFPESLQMVTCFWIVYLCSQLFLIIFYAYNCYRPVVVVVVVFILLLLVILYLLPYSLCASDMSFCGWSGIQTFPSIFVFLTALFFLNLFPHFSFCTYVCYLL